MWERRITLPMQRFLHDYLRCRVVQHIRDNVLNRLTRMVQRVGPRVQPVEHKCVLKGLPVSHAAHHVESVRSQMC
ncbi:hypothetical protein Y032_0627g806 [Ancylostoma ceylanicum]|uniref:Uncharacterized protein n=1 Tax=Ancylostoma ceylanicum TaxID=53326 RepID=A0A016WKH0_9BILA|nr:hypothetical protein Y032_0627g806 [Ancylostoma ceylanicum]